ncbi:MAG: D-alanyl-D-alanine carboxypeptidase, partial [Chitinophagaceae bacterium]
MKGTNYSLKQLLIINSSLLIISACSIEKQIAKSAQADVLDTKALQAAHVGISIFDPAANKYLYNYQGDKYFVPASNAKLPTCYAAMKYLGDSLVGFLVKETSDSIYLEPCGDPTFLNAEYRNQNIFNWLKNT